MRADKPHKEIIRHFGKAVALGQTLVLYRQAMKLMRSTSVTLVLTLLALSLLGEGETAEKTYPLQPDGPPGITEGSQHLLAVLYTANVFFHFTSPA